MEPASPPAILDVHRRSASDFAELSQIVRQAGLLDRRPGHYAVRVGLTLAALGAAWVAFVFLGDTWWQLVTAVFLAVVWAQVSFIGHDAGHKQIFRGRQANDAVGLVHAGLVGLSYSWWVRDLTSQEQNMPAIDAPQQPPHPPEFGPTAPAPSALTAGTPTTRSERGSALRRAPAG